MQKTQEAIEISVREVAYLSDPHLKSFVEHNATETIYYSQAWCNLISKLYGYTVIPLVAVDEEGQVHGLLLLCAIHSLLTGRRLVSLPFTDYCPLLAADHMIARRLTDHAIQLTRQQHMRYLELRTGFHEVLAEHKELVEANLYVRWVLPLSRDTASLWSGLRKPIQREIKKAQGQGVQVSVAESREAMKQYYRLHLLTRSKKHGMPAQSLQFFLELWDTFAPRGEIRLLLARYQEEVIAGTILLTSGTTVRYAYNASDEQHLHVAPNKLLLWQAITWAGQAGYQTLDMGRTAYDNQGLMEFKRRWGANKEALLYYYYPEARGLVATSESSWKFQMLTRCWKRLPFSFMSVLGGILYRHLG